MKQRPDDYFQRRTHLKEMTDKELKAYFEKLTDQMLDPLLDLSYTYTTPAIERSVLMRMGFSSLEAKGITDRLNEYHLLGHGAGHIVYKLSKDQKISIREAGMKLMSSENVEKMAEVFK